MRKKITKTFFKLILLPTCWNCLEKVMHKTGFVFEFVLGVGVLALGAIIVRDFGAPSPTICAGRTL
jgi:hypothetical protein